MIELSEGTISAATREMLHHGIAEHPCPNVGGVVRTMRRMVENIRWWFAGIGVAFRNLICESERFFAVPDYRFAECTYNFGRQRSSSFYERPSSRRVSGQPAPASRTVRDSHNDRLWSGERPGGSMQSYTAPNPAFGPS